MNNSDMLRTVDFYLREGFDRFGLKAGNFTVELNLDKHGLPKSITVTFPSTQSITLVVR